MDRSSAILCRSAIRGAFDLCHVRTSDGTRRSHSSQVRPSVVSFSLAFLPLSSPHILLVAYVVSLTAIPTSRSRSWFDTGWTTPSSPPPTPPSCQFPTSSPASSTHPPMLLLRSHATAALIHPLHPWPNGFFSVPTAPWPLFSATLVLSSSS